MAFNTCWLDGSEEVDDSCTEYESLMELASSLRRVAVLAATAAQLELG